ncbi:MAG: ABC transporter substrate-binding protein [Vicinamibacterales bacterium]
MARVKNLIRSIRGQPPGRRLAWVACASVWLAWGIGASGRPLPRRVDNITTGCVERFDPATDYFPDKVAVEDAVNFRVAYHRSYKLVSVEETYPGGPAERYVLLQCGAPAPALDGPLARAQLVRVPIASLFSASPTHLPLLVDLGRLDVLTGVPRLRDLVGDEIAARAATGQVREFAAASVIDAEIVASSRPSLFMTGGTASASVSVIRAAGVPVVANIEWREASALARAEWLKYMSLFLNEERRAQATYSAIKARYLSLRARATAGPQARRPLVMTGRSTLGTFTIAGGRSYVAALIRDAGGRYVWADNTAVGSAKVDLEAQIRRASNADVWINGGGWTSLASMLEDEPRYATFKAYRTGQVWVYERRLTPAGGNDYWSRSISHPDVVLADLIKIFHPDLVPEHALEWYIRVPARERP